MNSPILTPKIKTLSLALVLLMAVIVFANVGQDILHMIQSEFEALTRWYKQHPIYTIALFFILFTFVNACMIPGSLVLMLLAGALFDWPLGLVICVLSGTLGAVLAFSFIRYFSDKELHLKRYDLWQKMNNKFKENSITYLLVLRVSPGIPTNVISLMMGLSGISLLQFSLVTLVGVIPWYAVYVTGGEALMDIERVSDIVSWEVVIWSGVVAILLLFSVWVKMRYITSLTTKE